MKINGTPAGGFTLVEIMIAVVIVGLLAGISVPNFLKARCVAQANTCISHLRDIDSATQQWALETNRNEKQPVDYPDIKPYLKGQVVGPAGGTGFSDCYDLTVVGEKPTCRKVANGDHPHILPSDSR